MQRSSVMIFTGALKHGRTERTRIFGAEEIALHAPPMR
jgi:hypothetical protein